MMRDHKIKRKGLGLNVLVLLFFLLLVYSCKTSPKNKVALQSLVEFPVNFQAEKDSIAPYRDSLIRAPGSDFGRMRWENKKILETTLTIIDVDGDTVFNQNYGTGWFTVLKSEIPSGLHLLVFSDKFGLIKAEKTIIR